VNPALRRSKPSLTSLEAETQRTGIKSTSVKEGSVEVSGVIHMGRRGLVNNGRENSDDCASLANIDQICDLTYKQLVRPFFQPGLDLRVFAPTY